MKENIFYGNLIKGLVKDNDEWEEEADLSDRGHWREHIQVLNTINLGVAFIH